MLESNVFSTIDQRPLPIAPELFALPPGAEHAVVNKMSELPRRIVSRLRRYVGNRRRHKRVEVDLRVTLSFSDPHSRSNGSRRIPTITGQTLDISETGVALIVPAIRIGEHYLAGTDRTLLLKLELPDEPIEMWVVPVRYEEHSEGGYLIGARITSMEKEYRSSFEAFLVKMGVTLLR